MSGVYMLHRRRSSDADIVAALWKQRDAIDFERIHVEIDETTCIIQRLKDSNAFIARHLKEHAEDEEEQISTAAAAAASDILVFREAMKENAATIKEHERILRLMRELVRMQRCAVEGKAPVGGANESASQPFHFSI